MLSFVVAREAGHGRLVVQHERSVGNLEEFAAAGEEDRLGTVRRGVRRHLEQHDTGGYKDAEAGCVNCRQAVVD